MSNVIEDIAATCTKLREIAEHLEALDSESGEARTFRMCADYLMQTTLEARQLRHALYMCAAHCQGGHSHAGSAAAEVLGVPFPIRMNDLVPRAEADGFDPIVLWPWSLTATATQRPASAQAPSGSEGEGP